MPTYEYECTRCGHTFERFQSMTEEPVKRCPECRCKVRRLLGGGAGIIFKGAGFYETDYRRAGSKPPAEGGEKATASTAEKGAGGAGSESKPAGKSKASAAA